MAENNPSEQPGVDDSGGLLAVLNMLRRLLNYPVSVGLVLEVSLLAAIPYLIVGAVVSVASGDDWRQEQFQHGGDALLALVTSFVFWPALLLLHACVS
jgi:hypothetical protein